MAFEDLDPKRLKREHDKMVATLYGPFDPDGSFD
jgi:hypothetical protein